MDTSPEIIAKINAPILTRDDIWHPMALALEEKKKEIDMEADKRIQQIKIQMGGRPVAIEPEEKKREIDLEEQRKIQRINTELNFIFNENLKQLKKINYNEQYIIKNRDKLTERIECVCGKSYEKWNKSNHNKTKHHKQHIAN